ncbi:hypothetical protein [Streptomyces antibioticus]|nr:hypothetical protein [Streptomyces antibioticus]
MPLDVIRPDGAVLIPSAVARDGLRALAHDLLARVRANGAK